ncbi:MAG: nucleoside triphosphate pyrophosphohydrolase [Catalinimonas sp.]
MNENDPRRAAKLAAFDRLLTIMDELREQCPWDRKQTWESLRYLTIEELYELSDALLDNDAEEVRKELGDLMLHLVFYARIGSERGAFDVADVLDGICEKLIRRHPHIYGDVRADDEATVRRNWEALKLQEGHKSVLSGVPRSLPAVVKAMRIQEKARGAGFDWDERTQVWAKVQEELAEFGELHDQPNPDPARVAGEFGDLMFSLINYARFVDVEPEAALERTNKKFIRRFTYLEEAARRDGKRLPDLTLREMDVYWEAAKAEEG